MTWQTGSRPQTMSFKNPFDCARFVQCITSFQKSLIKLVEKKLDFTIEHDDSALKYETE